MVTRKIHANIIYTSGWSVKTYTLKHWSKADQSRVQDTKVLLDAYISVFDGELHVISSLQSFQITFELAVVKEDLLHHISPLNESKRLLKDNTSFSITAMVSIIQNVSSSACLKSTVCYFMEWTRISNCNKVNHLQRFYLWCILVNTSLYSIRTT